MTEDFDAVTHVVPIGGDPVTYTVIIQHWADGQVETQVNDVGHSERDRASVAWALRQAADKIESGTPVPSGMFS